MAQMSPDKIHLVSRKIEPGEEYVYRLIENMPESEKYYAYFDTRQSGQEYDYYPDFVIITPDLGLFILEVKDWSKGFIKKINKEKVLVHYSGKPKWVSNPLVQVRNYTNLMINELSKEESLINSKGLKFSYSFGIVFPYMTRSEFQSQVGNADVINLKACIFKDELKSPADLHKGLQRLASRYIGRFPTLNNDELALCRKYVFPEVSMDSDGLKKDLANEQRELVETIDYGLHLINAPVGSGKTVVLFHRTLLLAELQRNWRILVLCYNPVTRSFLERELKKNMPIGNHAMVDIYDVRELFHEIVLHCNLDEELPTDNYIRVLDRLNSQGDQFPKRYDAILIDKAQDFYEEWLTFIDRNLFENKNKNAHLFLTMDGTQNIYRQSYTLSWAGLHRSKVSKTLKLDINYRNTRQIIEFANAFINNEYLEKCVSDNVDSINYAVTDFDCIRDGEKPRVIVGIDLNDVNRKIVSMVHEVFNKSTNRARKICILCTHESIIPDLMDELNLRRVPFKLLSQEADHHNEGIWLGTIQQSKGLTFDHVVITGIENKIFTKMPEIDATKLIYVGMTRASNRLVIGLSERNIFRSILSNKSFDKIKKEFKLAGKYEYEIKLTTFSSDGDYTVLDESTFRGNGIENIVNQYNEKFWLPVYFRKEMFQFLCDIRKGDHGFVTAGDRLMYAKIIESPFPDHTRTQFLEYFTM
ncbi:3'-5' exonuclease [Paenibacillus chitinolyticus]|uniref:nuclease-related domain-containing DEAD/DEAH box helicase n=1 Tax=Paenibacillus chitinolyticus TaxID=79263 RepID=UPI00386431E9